MARRIPSLNWLRVFEAAARTESFARAAELLAMSPPAISQQVRALEDHLGQPLFHRGARRVELTEAGRAFLPPVRQALASVQTAAETLFPPPGTETLTLQAVSLLALGWLPPRIAAFEAAHPGIRVSLLSGNSPADFRRVLPGPGPDLQIVFGSAPVPGAGTLPLLGERLAIVARPDIAATLDRPARLAGQRLIDVAAHDSGWPRMLAALPEAAGRGTHTAFVDSTPVAFAMAAEGLGLALERAPASDGLRTAFGLARAPMSPVVAGTEQYHLLMPERRGPDRARRLLRDFLCAEAAAAEAALSFAR
ncbi:MAG: LysR family transcriptional regulator [Rhodobacteraceae bacterium]|nr:LysR family transcriptional regulator [Paracoccaceae bacterium]